MLAYRLKEIRKKLHLTQFEIAKALKVNPASISQFESNKVKPSIDTLLKLSDAYDVNIHWLLTGRGSMFLDNGTKMKADVPMFTRKFTDDEHSGLSDREYIEKVQDEVLELRKDLDELRRKLIDLQQKYIELMEKIRK